MLPFAFARVLGASLLLSLTFAGAASAQTEPSPPDHAELAALHAADQSDRAGPMDRIDFEVLLERDGLRRDRVRELMAMGALRTARDYYHGAMILQHGHDTTDFRQAHELARRAMALDSTDRRVRYLVAASWDRYLMTAGQPQWYGTQFRRATPGSAWELHPVDTSKVTDAERLRLGVGTLAEQRARADLLNRRPGQ